MKNPIGLVVLVLVQLAVGACGGAEEPAEEDVVAEAPAGEMEGMPGMGEMPMSAGMMERMQDHMQAMQGVSADSMVAAVPMHRQMVANMIAQMNREMQDMNMSADSEWTATVEALREDLVRMPEMTASELETLMPEHRNRVMRLLDMHREMMQNMRM